MGRYMVWSGGKRELRVLMVYGYASFPGRCESVKLVHMCLIGVINQS